MQNYVGFGLAGSFSAGPAAAEDRVPFCEKRNGMEQALKY